MSGVFNEQHQCKDKQRYFNRAFAKRRAKSTGFSGLQTYRCPWCGWWHIGGSMDWERKARTRQAAFEEGRITPILPDVPKSRRASRAKGS